MFIAKRHVRRKNSVRSSTTVLAAGHFTPKGVSVSAGPMAINIQPLRGCVPKLLLRY